MISLVAAAALGTTGCVRGANPARMPFAQQPVGAQVTLQARSARYVGELLEVRNDGLVLMEPKGRILFAPFSVVRRLTANKLGDAFGLTAGMPNADRIARLRSISHFPQGMTPDIQKRLLALMAQPEITVVR